ncbi:lymphocyte antigen 75 [Anguilla rostrata]|uniref:lymphocyte antigen 75 n=1 Tax=Anguilla rostrata TaxID=7938 RepID=UPI0030CEF067
MDGGTRAIVYVCVFLLVGQQAIHFGSCAPTLNNGEGIFNIRHADSGRCLWADLQGLQLLECSGAPEEQWKWGSGHRLFHVVTAQCLGLRVQNKSLALLDCSSSDGTLSWHCDEQALYVWSRKYLSVTEGKLGARNSLQDRWVRDNTSESICQYPYQVVFTSDGNSLGAPCEFPFRYNDTWYHGCIPDDSGYTWCSTTPDFDADRKLGYCLKYEEGCERLWNKSSSGYCYQHNRQSAVSWQEARASCHSQGGDLLSITSAAELDLVSNGDDPDQVWIGLNQLDMAQGWQWSDGSPLAFVNWNEGMTNFSILKESDCAVMTTKGLWEKAACTQKLPFICKKASNQTQPGSTSPWVLKAAKCEDGWSEWNGFCYKLVKDQPLAQLEAQKYCSSSQGSLVSTHSLADIAMISDLHTDGAMGIWTGLWSEEAPPLFQWIDKSPVSFTYWSRDEPRVLRESKPTCVSYYGEFFLWRVSSCEDKLPFMCKKKGENAETVVNAGCPTDGEWRRHGSACYKVDAKKVLFKDRCNLTITNRFEQAYINSLIRGQSETQYFWVGLQDANSTGEYQWSNKDGPNERLTFSNWAKDEPARLGQCAVMSSGKLLGQWQLQSCSLFSAGSVCKKEVGPHVAPDPEPDPSLPCPAGWESKQGLRYCYKVFHAERLSRQRSWEEAERFCEALGGHLPGLSNQDEMEALHTILRGSISNDRYFWIGLNRRNPASGNAWEWSDGRPVSSVIFSGELQEDDEYNRECVALKTMRRSYLSFILLLRGHSLQQFFASPFHCDAQLEWVCQIPRGKTPRTPAWYNPGGHHESSIFVDGKEFWFVSDPQLSYDEAGLYCSGNSSTLATPQTMNQVGVILSQLKKLSGERLSWWVEILESGLSFPMPFHPILHHYSTFHGRCSSLNPDSSIPEREYSCDRALPFVCEKVNTTSVERNPLEPHPGGLPCGNDSVAFRDKCYTVLQPKYLSFEKASELCQKLRGTLPVISSQAEQDFILSLLLGHLPRKLWIGLRRQHSRPDWKWADGSPLTLDNFNTLLHGQMRFLPISSFGTLDLCAILYNDASAEMMGTWDYRTCSEPQYVAVCEHYADKPESPKAPEGNFVVSNHTYRVLQGNMTWFTAVELCKKQDMDLASVLDGSQQAGLTAATGRAGAPLWIGLFSEDDGAHYRWTDHSHTVFSRWFSEPTSGRCVYLDTDGFWKATNCEEELAGAICHVPQVEKTLEDAAVKCPHRANGPGWTPFRNHCYAFYRQASRWAAFDKGDSRETCKKLDPSAEVLTIRDEEENDFVRKQLLPLRDMVMFVWIGIFKDNETNQLKWYDGTNVQYSNWFEGRPNITDKFMAGLSSSGSWKLFTSKHSFERIKQISVVACKIDYDSKEDFSKYVSDLENYGNLKYKVIPKKLTWSEALRECENMDGHLASAHELAQDAHLQMMSKMDGFPLWIGLSNQDEGGSSFEWSDGTIYDYKPLGFSYSGSEGNCMLVNRMGSWVQADCTTRQEGAICYVNTTQSPKASPQQSNACPKTAGVSRWIHYKEHCYAFDMTLFNYSVYTMEEAKTICNRLDESSQLLTIKDEDENTFVSRYIMENPLITKRVWLGLDLDAQGDSKWIDGTSVEFSNWGKKASALAATGPACAVMVSGEEGAWSRESCTEIRSRVVCKAPAPRRGTPAALAFFVILVIAILAIVLFLIWKRSRGRFSSRVRYQRNFDEADSAGILTEMENEFQKQ